MSYLVTIVGFVGADPEQRQARNNVPFQSTLSHVSPYRRQVELGRTLDMRDWWYAIIPSRRGA